MSSHGSLHIRSILPAPQFFVTKLHTTHDGYPQDTFSDCVTLPFNVFDRHVWHVDFPLDEFRKSKELPTMDEILTFLNHLNLFEVDPTLFACMMISRYHKKWFPLPMTDDTNLLAYWGIDSPDVIVEIDNERFIKVSFTSVDATSQMDYLEMLEDVLGQIQTMLPKHFHLFHFDKATYTVTYNFTHVMASLIYQQLENEKKWMQDQSGG